jgi:hypothetical protein
MRGIIEDSNAHKGETSAAQPANEQPTLEDKLMQEDITTRA